MPDPMTDSATASPSVATPPSSALTWKTAGGIDGGAAYIFHRNQGGTGNWGQVKKLTASDAEAADLFGVSVAVSGDTAIVGALGEDEAGSEAGAVYVFL